MSLSATHRVTRAALAGLATVTMVVTLSAVSASGASGSAGYPGATEPILDSLSAIPEVQGPILEDENSHMFSSMKRARVPFDVADFGYVEEEYFLTGTANVYDDASGELVVAVEDVPYVNRIIVRRPAHAVDASGVVDVDILNASNGFDGEDMWRRLSQHAFANGDTYIGLTSKPIQVDALKNYDPQRYESLSWDIQPGTVREPIVADPANPGAFNPNVVVPGAEEGLA